MVNSDIISMPDKWEYPWYAAWDLAFHTLPLGIVDPEFAKDQLRLMLRARYLHPSGQIPAYEWNFSDVNPPVHAFATLFIHRAEQALRRSEALYRSLVETSNDLVWSCDLEGRWTYLNPAAARRIYDGKAADLVGTPLQELTAPELRERDAAVFARVLAGDPVFRHETRHQRRDGSSVDLSFNAVPLRDARGAITGATGTARDITEERAAAAALHESVEKLRLAVDAAELVYWEWDRDTDRLHWGRNPARSSGRPASASR